MTPGFEHIEKLMNNHSTEIRKLSQKNDKNKQLFLSDIDTSNNGLKPILRKDKAEGGQKNKHGHIVIEDLSQKKHHNNTDKISKRNFNEEGGVNIEKNRQRKKEMNSRMLHYSSSKTDYQKSEWNHIYRSEKKEASNSIKKVTDILNKEASEIDSKLKNSELKISKFTSFKDKLDQEAIYLELQIKKETLLKKRRQMEKDFMNQNSLHKKNIF